MSSDVWGFLPSLRADLGIDPGSASSQLFSDHLDLLDRWNAVVTLSTITDRHEQAIKHVYDSLQLAGLIDESVHELADVGTGGGFPGGPLGVAFKRLSLTFIEKDSAKCRYLEVLSKRLGLNAAVLCESSTNVAATGARFDLVVSRALISPMETLGLVLPLVVQGGRAALMLGPSAKEQTGQLGELAKTLGCDLEEVIEYELPEGFGDRLILSFRRASTDEVR